MSIYVLRSKNLRPKHFSKTVYKVRYLDTGLPSNPERLMMSCYVDLYEVSRFLSKRVRGKFGIETTHLVLLLVINVYESHKFKPKVPPSRITPVDCRAHINSTTKLSAVLIYLVFRAHTNKSHNNHTKLGWYKRNLFVSLLWIKLLW